MIRTMRRLIGAMARLALDLESIAEEADWTRYPLLKAGRLHLRRVMIEDRQSRRVPRTLCGWMTWSEMTETGGVDATCGGGK